VYSDNDHTISFKIPRAAVISSAMLSPFATCEINFENRMLIISLQPTEPLSPHSPRPTELNPVTVGEKYAAEMANTMGRIDFDNLVPTFRITSNQLIIGRLLRIDNSALRRQLSADSIGYEYRMLDRVCVVLFPVVKKRKAG
jgi:hypothetical protein